MVILNLHPAKGSKLRNNYACLYASDSKGSVVRRTAKGCREYSPWFRVYYNGPFPLEGDNTSFRKKKEKKRNGPRVTRYSIEKEIV